MCSEWEQPSPFQRAFSSWISGDVPRSGRGDNWVIIPWNLQGECGTATTDRIESVTKWYSELSGLQWLSLSMQVGVVTVWKCQLEEKLWTPVDAGSHCVDYQSIHHNWYLNTGRAGLEGTTGRSSSPFFSSRIPQSTFLRIVSSDSFWMSPEETPQPLWVWHVSLAEDLQWEGWTEEWGLHRIVFLAQKIIYSDQAWELCWWRLFGRTCTAPYA